MALGLGQDADEKAAGAKAANLESEYSGFQADVEQQNGYRNRQTGRKMSRIDAPITASIGRKASTAEGRKSVDDIDNGISIGDLHDEEAGNAIKYRTCSWQKVCTRVLEDCLA